MVDPRRVKLAEPQPLPSEYAQMWRSASARAPARSAPSSSVIAFPCRRGHADELAIPMRLPCHVAQAPWPASLPDEPVPAVELCDFLQQPVADLASNIVSIPIRRSVSASPRSMPYTANAWGATPPWRSPSPPCRTPLARLSAPPARTRPALPAASAGLTPPATKSSPARWWRAAPSTSAARMTRYTRVRVNFVGMPGSAGLRG